MSGHSSSYPVGGDRGNITGRRPRNARRRRPNSRRPRLYCCQRYCRVGGGQESLSNTLVRIQLKQKDTKHVSAGMHFIQVRRRPNSRRPRLYCCRRYCNPEGGEGAGNVK